MELRKPEKSVQSDHSLVYIGILQIVGKIKGYLSHARRFEFLWLLKRMPIV